MSIQSYNSIPSKYDKSDKSIIKEVNELSFADTSITLNNDLPFTPNNDVLFTSTLNDPLSVEKHSTLQKEKLSPKMGPLQPQISINFEKDKIEAKKLEKEKKKINNLLKKKKMNDDKENDAEDMKDLDNGQMFRKGSTIDEPPEDTPFKQKKKIVGEASDNNHPLKPIQNKNTVKYVKGLTDKHSNVRKPSSKSGRKPTL